MAIVEAPCVDACALIRTSLTARWCGRRTPVRHHARAARTEKSGNVVPSIAEVKEQIIAVTVARRVRGGCARKRAIDLRMESFVS